jgi:hypothetical protein
VKKRAEAAAALADCLLLTLDELGEWLANGASYALEHGE